jgi:hypothetical protein
MPHCKTELIILLITEFSCRTIRYPCPEAYAVTNVLLITDVPRLMKIFSRLVDDCNVRLRMVNNLEHGGEEIVADKPAVIFVQAHLSGLSADILLKHLKKQLGKKRSRFVLLGSSEQTTEEAVANYHGHIDTSQDDMALSVAIRDCITGPGRHKPAEPAFVMQAPVIASQPQKKITSECPGESDQIKQGFSATDIGAGSKEAGQYSESQLTPFTLQAIPDNDGESLEKLGITYSARPRVSVQSGFTSSFDSAVEETAHPEPVTKSQTLNSRMWSYEEIETSDPLQPRSKIATFFLWLVPVLAIAIVVTIFQQRKLQPSAKVEPAQAKTAPASPAKQVVAPTPVVPVNPTVNLPAPTQPVQPVSPPQVASPLKNLPDFVPRAGQDKSYSAVNPGWERYKGHSTEFRIYRDGEFIKAIQVLDHSGKGVPDSFMKGVLKQVSNSPVFTLGTSEKKDGYEIQRGKLGDSIKAVYYRDEQGGTIRAFVLTWQ